MASSPGFTSSTERFAWFRVDFCDSVAACGVSVAPCGASGAVAGGFVCANPAQASKNKHNSFIRITPPIGAMQDRDHVWLATGRPPGGGLATSLDGLLLHAASPDASELRAPCCRPERR